MPTAVLHGGRLLAEDNFWQEAAACVTRYRSRVPHLAHRVARVDLFPERFPLSCLNRLQLRNNERMVDLDGPVGSLSLAGTLANPLARFAGACPDARPPGRRSPASRPR